MNKILYADAAGVALQKAFGKSQIALAGLVPATLVSPADSIPAKIADVGIAAIVPFHAHYGLSVGTSPWLVVPGFLFFFPPPSIAPRTLTLNLTHAMYAMQSLPTMFPGCCKYLRVLASLDCPV